jgi:signal transduction histidine kinase
MMLRLVPPLLRFAPSGLALVLLAGSIAEIAFAAGSNGWGGGTGVEVLVALAATAPLVLLRRAPVPAAAAIAAACAVAVVVVAPAQSPFEPFVALLVAFVAAGASARVRDSSVLLAIVLAAGFGAIAAGMNGGVSNTFPALVLIALGWGAGVALRGRAMLAQQFEEVAVELAAERAERERAAIATERARIARELHDVVAHNVSVMVLHAEAGSRSMRDAKRVAESFETIETVGRQTVDELRRLLGMLRHDEEFALSPPPSLLHVDELAEHVRRTGLSVEVDVSGRRNGFAPGLDVAAYRIVQEALTNVLKHARAASATVAIEYGEHAVRIEVTDDGVGPAPAAQGGQGLIGMRERAALYGGRLESGSGPGGGFLVRAVLPLRGGQE